MLCFPFFQLKFCWVFLSLLTLTALSKAQSSAADLEYLDNLYKQQQYQELIENLTQVSRAQMTTEHFRYLIYSHAELNLDMAERAAEEAISILPTEADVYLIHASIMGSQVSNSEDDKASVYGQKAISSLHKAIQLKPDDIQYREALISFYINAPADIGGDKDLALYQIQLLEDMDMIQGRVYLAWYYRSIEQADTALDILLKAKKDFPNNISVLNALASHYLAVKAYSEAIDAYVSIIKVALIRPMEDELEVLEAFDEARYRQVNAHYQIGRISLLGKVRLAEGIKHMKMYIDTLLKPQSIGVMDPSNLPTISWAYLRLSGLLLASDLKKPAADAFALVSLDKKDEYMQQVYKKLSSQLK